MGPGAEGFARITGGEKASGYLRILMTNTTYLDPERSGTPVGRSVKFT